jgi:hypothetical protein
LSWHQYFDLFETLHKNTIINTVKLFHFMLGASQPRCPVMQSYA